MSSSVQVPSPELLSTPSLRLERLAERHAPRLAAYQRRNRHAHAPTSPPRPRSFYDDKHWEALAVERRGPIEEARALLWLLFDAADGGQGPVVGAAQLSNIVRGAMWGCTLGYALDHEHVGRGWMTEALRAVTEHAFVVLHLNRVMANYMPNNERSAAVLERVGFVREGLARGYLYIDGAWRDHVLTALRNPRPRTVTFPDAADPKAEEPDAADS